METLPTELFEFIYMLAHRNAMVIFVCKHWHRKFLSTIEKMRSDFMDHRVKFASCLKDLPNYIYEEYISPNKYMECFDHSWYAKHLQIRQLLYRTTIYWVCNNGEIVQIDVIDSVSPNVDFSSTDVMCPYAEGHCTCTRYELLKRKDFPQKLPYTVTDSEDEDRVVRWLARPYDRNTYLAVYINWSDTNILGTADARYPI